MSSTLFSHLPRYYAYRHIRNDTNTPFYVGIGKQMPGTGSYGRASSKHCRNKYWVNIVAKHGYTVEIFYETSIESEIIAKEKEFISLYGRRDLGNGILVNMTDGGEGRFSYSIEQRREYAERMRGRVSPMKGKKLSEETRKKMSEVQSQRNYSYLKGLKKHTQENKDRLSNRNIGNKYNLGKFHSEETKIKMSERAVKKPLVVYDAIGQLIGVYPSVLIASKRMGVADTFISSCLTGKRKHRRFIFKYKINNATYDPIIYGQ